MNASGPPARGGSRSRSAGRAAYRLGHSQIRAAYQWNRFVKTDGGDRAGLLHAYEGRADDLLNPVD